MKNPSNLAIGQEYVPANEESEIDEIVAIHRDVQDKVDAKLRPVPRGQHPKQHGCVLAYFIVEPSLPPQYRHGVFARALTYTTLARFSNAKQRDDRLPDGHGVALKLFEVEGAKLLGDRPDAKTQDFILVDHPVFFVKNVRDYIPLMQDFRRLAAGGLFAKSRAVLKGMFSPDYRFRLLRAMGRKRPDTPLGIQYWSTTPFKLGDGAMKFSLRPDPNYAVVRPPSSSRDKLGIALAAHLDVGEARFDFLAQLQTDPVKMPIEDPTILWDERASPYTKIASLVIPKQSFTSETQRKFAENLSFSPWHGLEAHRPLGGVNRTRRKVYLSIAHRRRELNEAPQLEPSVDEVRALWSLG